MGELRKVTRKKAKIRLGLSSVSGGGKTYSGLLIAKGLSGGNLEKVALIDTENGSGDLYAHLGSYNVFPLNAPYTPERYIEAIIACEKAGMDVIIIDSITHEWDGKGGILDIQNSLTGNSYTNWAKLTPRHQAFIDKILQSECHIITTVRRKQDYEMIKDEKGKLVPQKVGLREVTREGFEYELTVNLELDTKHNASCSKDRTGLFADKPEFVPTESTGEMLREWCEMGVDANILKKNDEALASSFLVNANDLKVEKEDTIKKLTENQLKKTISLGKEKIKQCLDAFEEGSIALTDEQYLILKNELDFIQ